MTSRTRTALLTLALAVLITTTAAPPIRADEPVPSREEVRERIRTAVEDGDAARIRTETRERIRLVLEGCADDGLPLEPVLAKVREGLRKRASDAAIANAVDRMATHVRTAGSLADALEAEGGSVDPEPVRALAQYLWAGLGDDALEHLGDQARLRLRDGSCSLGDVASAASTILALRANGSDPEVSVRLTGTALRLGYDASDLRAMALLADGAGTSRIGTMLHDLETALGEGMSSDAMFQHMTQAGWTGASGDGGLTGTAPLDPGAGAGGSGGSGGGSGGNGNGGGS